MAALPFGLAGLLGKGIKSMKGPSGPKGLLDPDMDMEGLLAAMREQYPEVVDRSILSKYGNISDDAFSLKEKGDFEGLLGDVVQHDELFARYPELKEYNIRLKDAEQDAYFEAQNKLFNISGRKYSERALDTLHELQHSVDSLEGADAGTSPHNVLALMQNNPKFQDYYTSAMEQDPIAVQLMDRVLQLEDLGKDSTEAMASFQQHMAEQLYLKNLGETRARHTVNKYNNPLMTSEPSYEDTWKLTDFDAEAYPDRSSATNIFDMPIPAYNKYAEEPSVEIIENPTIAELVKLKQKAMQGPLAPIPENTAVRWQHSRGKTPYAWRADLAMHEDVTEYLKQQGIDIRYDPTAGGFWSNGEFIPHARYSR